MAIRKLARSEDELHEAAIRETGFQDFGDPAYRDGLRVLLDAFDTDFQLTGDGWQVAYRMFVRRLSARLYTQRGFVEHPEVLATPIHRPMVITGLPRTGTTALHRLLSQDSQFQGLEAWLLHNPVIRPPRENWETHPAYRACIARIEESYIRMPELRTMHNFAAGEVEECTAILLNSFVSSTWLAAYMLPTYDRWLASKSAQESYRLHIAVLRLIGASAPHRRWLLKSPEHMAEMQTLLEVFPDACVIQTHRDPLQAIPSLCSLTNTSTRDFEGNAVRQNLIGPWQCAFWREALDRTQAARQKSPKQFFDVDHRWFLADPLGVVHSIYEYFSLALSPHTEQQMRAWVAANRTSSNLKHHYSTDSWGITPAQICDTFADYRAQHQFDTPIDSSR